MTFDGHPVRRIVIPAVFGGFVPGHCLENFMPLPVVFQCLDQLGHGAFLFVINQIFDGKQRIHGGGVGDGFQGGMADFSPALGDIQSLFQRTLSPGRTDRAC